MSLNNGNGKRDVIRLTPREIGRISFKRARQAGEDENDQYLVSYTITRLLQELSRGRRPLFSRNSAISFQNFTDRMGIVIDSLLGIDNASDTYVGDPKRIFEKIAEEIPANRMTDRLSQAIGEEVDRADEDKVVEAISEVVQDAISEVEKAYLSAAGLTVEDITTMNEAFFEELFRQIGAVDPEAEAVPDWKREAESWLMSFENAKRAEILEMAERVTGLTLKEDVAESLGDTSIEATNTGSISEERLAILLADVRREEEEEDLERDSALWGDEEEAQEEVHHDHYERRRRWA